MAKKKFRISIFPPKTSLIEVIESNGTVLDNICIKYYTSEECSVTGDYTLDAEFYVDHDLSKNVDNDCIIKCLIDNEYEIFRIVKCDPSTRYTTIVGKQITITEQKQLWLDDVRPTDASGLVALQHMYNNAIGIKEINIFSDIDIVNTAYYQTMNMYKACYDCDQSFTNRWGTSGIETKRRLNNIYLNKKRGKQSNFSIREGKNLTGFKGSSNIESFITRAVGEGFNGIRGHYIESPNVNKYSRVNTSVIKYPDVRLRTSDMKEDEEGLIFNTLEEVQAELDRRIKLEYSENHIDEIIATYTINFAQLEKTEEYKDYSYIEKADVGDYIKVYIPSLDIELMMRIVKKKFDGMPQRVSEMTISNTPLTASISTAKILENLKKEYITSGNTNIGEYIAAILNSGMKDSNVVIRENEILVMDTKDINTARNVWRWNAGSLAHSSDGYYSKNWNIGITQNGEINADLIRFGTMIGILLKSKDDSTVIDLANGTIKFTKGLLKGSNSEFNLDENYLRFSKNNEKTLEILSNSIKFYNWNKNGDYVGQIGPIVSTDGENFPSLALYHDYDSALMIGFKKDDTLTAYSYATFDAKLLRYSCPIIFWLETKFLYPILADGIKSPNKVFTIGTDGSDTTIAYGDFTVTGNKHCMQHTKNYGDRLFYSVEDAESYLTLRTNESISTGLKKEIKIEIDSIYKECVNTEIDYIVEINKYSFGDYRIKEQTKDYFTVESDRENFEFKYTIVAKRRGYENEHMNLFKGVTK